MICLNTGKKLILLAISFLFMFYPLSHISTQNTAQSPPSEEPIASASSLSAPQPVVEKITEKGVPVLMYHSISTNPSNTLCVSEKDFSEQMGWLKSQGFHSITVEQLYNALSKGSPLPEKPVLITFDDGYRDNYLAAWPTLKQNGFVGTFFIITNAIIPSRIDWHELKDLVKNGNSIGSHTVDHLDLRTLNDSQQEREIGDSKKILEDGLGIKIISFCYPAGKYNKVSLSILSKYDYKLAFTTDPGRVHNGDDPLELKRVRISGGNSLSSFKSLLS